VIQGALAGLAIGGVYALTAVCLTLMARLVRVINFAQVAIGMFGVFVAAWLVTIGWPQWLAVIAGILAGGAISAVLGLILATWLSDASISVRSAATVGALLVLISVSFLLFGTKPQVFRAVFAGAAVSIGGVSISQVTVVMVALALTIAVVARLLLARTRAGMLLRAISDRPVTAELLGIHVKSMSVAVWASVGVVITAAVTIVAPTQTSDALTLSMLVVPAMAAALLGAFTRLDLAVIGGVALGVLQGAIAQFGELVMIRSWIPLVLIVAFLLYRQRREVWDAAR
jgi:branched-chain amino acid transport system permease protein